MIERLDVPVGGGTLAAFRLSDGPETVLAVHGITANSRSWLPVARSLAGRASLVAVDLRGRGSSSALPGPYGMAAYASDLRVAEKGPDNPVTKADLEANTRIRDLVSAAFPDDGWLSEERRSALSRAAV